MVTTVLLSIIAALLAFLSLYVYRGGRRMYAEVEALRAAVNDAAALARGVAANLEAEQRKVDQARRNT